MAAELVATIKKLMQRTGNAKEFGAWLPDVRAKHKVKHNLMRLLEEFGSP